MRHRSVFLTALVAIQCSTMVSSQTVTGQESGAAAVDFSEVRGVLRKRCVTCHNLDEARGDLDLSSLTAIEAGSGSGPVVVPGNPNESLLYTVAAHLEEPVMPPNSPKIPGRELDLVKRWIEGLQPTTKADTSSAMEAPQTGAAQQDSTSDESGIVDLRPLFRATAISALTVHPFKPIFAVSGRGQAVIGDLTTGSWIGGINFPHGEVTALKFSNDGETLLIAGGVAGLSGTVVGVDVTTGEKKFHIADEVDTILAVDLSMSNRLVAVGGPSKVVRLYSIDSGDVVHTLRKHTDWIMSLSFSPDGLLLASGDRFGGVFVWNPDDGQLFSTLPGHQGSVPAICWDNGSETLLTGCGDGKLRVWNMHHGELTTSWDAEVGPILSISHSANNTTIVGGRDKKASIWAGPGNLVAVSTAVDQVVQACVNSDGSLGILGDSVGNICLVTCSDGIIQKTIQLPVDGSEVDGLLARLASMEAEYLANVDLEKESELKASSVIADSDLSTPEISTQSGVNSEPGNTAAIQVLLTELKAQQAAMQELQQSQQQLVENLVTLRKKSQQIEEAIASAESQAEHLMECQQQLLDRSSQQLAMVQTLLNSGMNPKALRDRLQVEMKLLTDAEKLVASISEQPHLLDSEEYDLLTKLQKSIKQRSETTQMMLEIYDK